MTFINSKILTNELKTSKSNIRDILLDSRKYIKHKINIIKIENYYFELSKTFINITKEKNINSLELINQMKENILLKDLSKDNLVSYKNIFEGMYVPSSEIVYNLFEKYDDLPSYLSIIYLGQNINPELKNAYYILKNI
tara:strand:- start:235 stop:651 length:417 start_codon:yes stop_codon:yes gene_type:complete